MESVIVDQFRQRQAQRRGAGVVEVTLATGVDARAETYDVDRFDALHAALAAARSESTPRLHELVRLRAFAGLSIDEAAELLGSVDRHRQAALAAGDDDPARGHGTRLIRFVRDLRLSRQSLEECP